MNSRTEITSSSQQMQKVCVYVGGVQHNLISFHDKSLSEIVIDGTCVNTMKTVYNKAVGNTMINGEKSPLKSKTGQGSPLFHSY